MKRISILFILFCCLQLAHAQINIQHYEGIMGAELSAHKTAIGTNVKLGLSKYISNKIYWKVSGGYGSGRMYQVLFRNFTLDGAVFYSPVNLDGLVFINLSAGAILSYERMKNFIPTNNSFINYGGRAGLELEIPVYDGLLLVANGYQEFLAKKSFGQKRYEIGLGVKILIN